MGCQSITFQDVLDDPNKPWDWEMLSDNSTVTIQIVYDNLNKEWDWDQREGYSDICAMRIAIRRMNPVASDSNVSSRI